MAEDSPSRAGMPWKWVWIAAGAIAFSGFAAIFAVHMAMPNIMGSGMSAAEKAAVSRLRSLLWAQDTVKKLASVDRDGDGVAEYALFRQLASRASIPGGAPMKIPLLQGELAIPSLTAPVAVLEFAGYCQVIYLPAVGGGGVVEPREGEEPTGAVDADGAERAWVAYAWPVEREKSGVKTFFINQDEEIWQTDGAGPGQGYSGCEKVPAATAALPGNSLTEPPVEGKPHGDGGVWTRWKNKRARTLP